MAPNIDYSVIARATAGASGAELANIVNEAALRAVRNNRTQVEQGDLEEAVETVIAGYQRKSAVVSEKDKKIVAYHEIGHALVAAMQKHSAPVHKITIVPRTSGALGYTMQVEEEDTLLMSKRKRLIKSQLIPAEGWQKRLSSVPSPRVHPTISNRQPSLPARWLPVLV